MICSCSNSLSLIYPKSKMKVIYSVLVNIPLFVKIVEILFHINFLSQCRTKFEIDIIYQFIFVLSTNHKLLMEYVAEFDIIFKNVLSGYKTFLYISGKISCSIEAVV